MLGVTLFPLALKRSGEVKLLPLVRGTLGALDAQLGITKEVRGVGHGDGIFGLLREGKDAGDVGNEGVERLVGDRRILEIEEADVDQSMAKLVNEGRASRRVGQEGVVQDRDRLKGHG